MTKRSELDTQNAPEAISLFQKISTHTGALKNTLINDWQILLGPLKWHRN